MGRASRAKQTIPCIARNADGTRCGRRIPLGTSPQTCHIHAAQAAGGAVGVRITHTRTPRERLEKIAATDSHPNQLQAIKTLLDLEAVADHDVFASAWKAFMREITVEEQAELNAHRLGVRLIQHRVWQRCAEARTKSYCPPVLIATNEYPEGTLFIRDGAICEAGEMPEPPPPITLVQEETDDEEVIEEEETFDPSKHGPEFFDSDES